MVTPGVSALYGLVKNTYGAGSTVVSLILGSKRREEERKKEELRLELMMKQQQEEEGQDELHST